LSGSTLTLGSASSTSRIPYETLPEPVTANTIGDYDLGNPPFSIFL